MSGTIVDRGFGSVHTTIERWQRTISVGIVRAFRGGAVVS